MWFGSSLVACLLYVPAATAATMAVFLCVPRMRYTDFLGGYALLSGLVAYAGATIGVGGSLLFTISAVGSCVLLLLDPQARF